VSGEGFFPYNTQHPLLTSFYFLSYTDRGVEKHAELDGLSASDIEKKVTELISQGGKA
jgi:hypothetical protein